MKHYNDHKWFPLAFDDLAPAYPMNEAIIDGRSTDEGYFFSKKLLAPAFENIKRRLCTTVGNWTYGQMPPIHDN